VQRVEGLGGVFIRSHDPDRLKAAADGNRVELWQPAPVRRSVHALVRSGAP